MSDEEAERRWRDDGEEIVVSENDGMMSAAVKYEYIEHFCKVLCLALGRL
jgi:hypothetical protein